MVQLIISQLMILALVAGFYIYFKRSSLGRKEQS